MAELVLPAYRGIEEAMQDVRTYAKDKGVEKAIGLLPDGKRAFEVTGGETGVELPEEFRGTRDLFVIHGHPRLVTELSDADIKVITAMGVAGNMAVCDSDDTVSWTSGIDFQGKPRGGFGLFMAQVFMDSVKDQSFLKIDPQINNRVRGKNGEPWEDLDERWVVVSHLTNSAYVKSGFLRDYHVRHGEVELEVLGRWLPKLGLEVPTR